MINSELSEQRVKRISLAVLFSIVILVGLTLLSFLFFDGRLFSLLCNHGDVWGKNAWIKAAGQFGKTDFLIWLVLILIAMTGRSRPAVTVLLVLLLVWPVVWSTKVVASRPRPRDIIEKNAEVEKQSVFIRSWSFPSGDAASAFAAATALTPFVSAPLAVFFFLIAAVVGATRVLVFAHYLSDVLGGVVVGIFVGWLALRIVQKKIPPDFLQFQYYRIVAAIGVILIPLTIYLHRGNGQLAFFLGAGFVFLAAAYLINLFGGRISGGKDSSS
jgi:undecaprenyl-diphosphatase